MKNSKTDGVRHAKGAKKVMPPAFPHVKGNKPTAAKVARPNNLDPKGLPTALNG